MNERDRETRQLEAASADELAEHARRALRYGFAHEGIAERLAGADGWTDAKLCAALRAMFAELGAGDAARGVSGRDSDVFSFYDSGLARLTEILERRAPRDG